MGFRESSPAALHIRHATCACVCMHTRHMHVLRMHILWLPPQHATCAYVCMRTRHMHVLLWLPPLHDVAVAWR